jgi:hypothetical protein
LQRVYNLAFGNKINGLVMVPVVLARAKDAIPFEVELGLRQDSVGQMGLRRPLSGVFQDNPLICRRYCLRLARSPQSSHGGISPSIVFAASRFAVDGAYRACGVSLSLVDRLPMRSV